MNRWAVRLVGILMVLLFLVVFTHMYRTLQMLQRQQLEPTTATAP